MKLENIINLIEPPISGEWGTDVSELSQNVAKVIRTTNFTNIGKIDYEKEVVLRDIEEKKVANKKLLCGDIIVEKSGGSPTQPVGRVVYFDLDTDENYLCNNFTSVLRPKSDKVHSKYLFWMLFYQHLSKKTLNFQNKTTGIINLKLDRYVKEIQIPLPPLDIQKKIADTLDKAQELIDKRKEQITVLDKFLENLFLDMFGDPVSNPMGWEIKELKNIILTVTNGITRRRKISENIGDIVLRLRDIKINSIDYSDTNRIPLETKEKEKFKAELGDLLFIRVNGNPEYVGRCSVFKGFLENVYFNDHIMRVRFDLNHSNSIFLSHYLNNNFGKKEIKKSLKTSAGQHTISQSGLEKVAIILPPLDLQNQFASIVEKVEAEKTKLEASLKEMEDNFNSIMQRAFKGELF